MNTLTGRSLCTVRLACGMQRREATLNWLALGLLLAAWNAAGDDPAAAAPRPAALRAHPQVSVRAALRAQACGP